MFTLMTNAARAENALRAVQAFGGWDYNPGPEDLQTQVKDLMTNLLHLARRECGVQDAHHFAKLAADMHEAEVSEDPEE